MAKKPSVKVKWKDGFRAKVKPDVAYAEFERLRKLHGSLREEDIVEAARSPENPLHSQFDWDESSRAFRGWCEDARNLARKLVVIIEGRPQSDPVYINVLRPGDEDRSYVPVGEVKASEDMYAQAESEAAAGLQSWITRYSFINPEAMKHVKTGHKILADRKQQPVAMGMAG